MPHSASFAVKKLAHNSYKAYASIYEYVAREDEVCTNHQEGIEGSHFWCAFCARAFRVHLCIAWHCDLFTSARRAR